MSIYGLGLLLTVAGALVPVTLAVLAVLAVAMLSAPSPVELDWNEMED